MIVQGLTSLAIAVVGLLFPLPGEKQGLSGTEPAVQCDLTLTPQSRTTIARAVRARKRVRTICLHGGVYSTGEVWLKRRGMTIMSVPGERATWRGRIVAWAPDITLERLTLDGTARRRRASLPSPTINGPGFTLRDSDVTNRNGICVHPLPYRGRTPTNFAIERNRIHDCGRRPRTNQDHGIYVAGGSGVILWNAIFDNADRGIQLFPHARGVSIYGNTIDGNGEGVSFGEAVAGNLVTGNLITNSRARFNVEYHDLYGRGNSVIGNCLHATSRDPYYRRRGGIAPGIERYLRLAGNLQSGCDGIVAPGRVGAGP